MKAEDLDKKFDEGAEDIIDDLDLKTAWRANQESKRINVDFPAWVVESLDRESARIGVTRQSIIKVWLVERLRAESVNTLPPTETTSRSSSD
ncbi:type II toxin-antitoxin system BrnA family antitoxin [Spiribacter salinus]|uniref:type II toxin-antitoxin system BrnA family antitoxin n=1 Tax=Spiribacter salinus TaxID=1335746 RepID=UPI001C946AC6|nr:CopG family transcriptional regulator [Spiribacter salinus]MBY5267729.1 CopG family transcriptional regulator [Spiribacter salinus]